MSIKQPDDFKGFSFSKGRRQGWLRRADAEIGAPLPTPRFRANPRPFAFALPPICYCDPMESQPAVEVRATNPDDLGRNSDKRQATADSPFPDSSSLDAADIRRCRHVIEKFLWGKCGSTVTPCNHILTEVMNF
jgi:hypothetical protein